MALFQLPQESPNDQDRLLDCSDCSQTQPKKSNPVHAAQPIPSYPIPAEIPNNRPRNHHERQKHCQSNNPNLPINLLVFGISTRKLGSLVVFHLFILFHATISWDTAVRFSKVLRDSARAQPRHFRIPYTWKNLPVLIRFCNSQSDIRHTCSAVAVSGHTTF